MALGGIDAVLGFQKVQLNPLKRSVAPHAGAWIETSAHQSTICQRFS